MIQEIPADFAFQENISLENIEDGMRAVESNVKIALAILSVSLGRIKKDGLYLSITPDFKSYLSQERTNLSYRKAVHLAAIGEKFWEFRPLLKENNIRLSENMSKVRLLKNDIVSTDPMFWERFNSLSVRELKSYIQRKKDCINVYTANEMTGTVTVNNASLYIGEEKVRGINLNEIRQQTAQGKRAVVFFVNDDTQARKVRRALNGVI